MIRNHFVIRYRDLPKNTSKGTPLPTRFALHFHVITGVSIKRPRARDVESTRACHERFISRAGMSRARDVPKARVLNFLINWGTFIYTYTLTTCHLPPVQRTAYTQRPTLTTRTAYTHHPYSVHTLRVYIYNVSTNSSTAQRPTLTTCCCCCSTAQHTYHTAPTSQHLLLQLNSSTHVYM